MFTAAPAFCRVAATLTPTSDSDIKIEVWLPLSGWNGKFQAVGNGGWLGSIPYTALAEAVAAGYATAATDTGHVGNSAAFALGHPEKLIDFAYRAVHEMTARAKSVIDAFYGRAPALSIWNGCSQGGRQGIAEAVRYPADFDAIVAGAPAVNYMHLHAGRMAMNRAVNATPEAVIPPAKYPLVHRAALAACDARDGVTDGVIENPAACTFDPRTLQCSAQDDTDVPDAGADPVGAGDVWRRRASGHEGQRAARPRARLRAGVGGDRQPAADPLRGRRFQVHHRQGSGVGRDRGSTRRSTSTARIAADPDDAVGSTNPDLRAFFARGGKLLLVPRLVRCRR